MSSGNQLRVPREHLEYQKRTEENEDAIEAIDPEAVKESETEGTLLESFRTLEAKLALLLALTLLELLCLGKSGEGGIEDELKELGPEASERRSSGIGSVARPMEGLEATLLSRLLARAAFSRAVWRSDSAWREKKPSRSAHSLDLRLSRDRASTRTCDSLAAASTAFAVASTSFGRAYDLADVSADEGAFGC